MCFIGHLECFQETLAEDEKAVVERIVLSRFESLALVLEFVKRVAAQADFNRDICGRLLVKGNSGRIDGGVEHTVRLIIEQPQLRPIEAVSRSKEDALFRGFKGTQTMIILVSETIVRDSFKVHAVSGFEKVKARSSAHAVIVYPKIIDKLTNRIVAEKLVNFRTDKLRQQPGNLFIGGYKIVKAVNRRLFFTV